ncbi:hypothetical protein HJ588_03715 [Flexivirga sp. ID2601S]|uniref:SCP2 domain-containing protein n=1 Tax=Flexivirga aerilata TaxID=1656889 RepID=A0A849AEX7_9MICO|nr:hypothetical protein [Flexivirga aerilata]NNG38383.1 hypothetical protein [Flexivirga aerilata]
MTTLEQIEARLSPQGPVREEWANVGATVRFNISAPDMEVTIGADGLVTTDEPTHVVEISWDDLSDLLCGRSTFLASFTSGRVRVYGPVVQTIAIAQLLPSLSRNA